VTDGDSRRDVEGVDGPPELQRTIKVWDLGVRLTHWTNVICIGVLSVTGYYISSPFITTQGSASAHFYMGWVRYIHFLFAFVFTASVLFRVYWFFAGNRWASWRDWLPATRSRVTRLLQQLKYYFFLRSKPPAEVGHNGLAGAAYAALYLFFAVQIVTGFALYSQGFEDGFWVTAFGWLLTLFGAPGLRLVHMLVMFVILAFVIHHVYSAILIDTEERSGVVSSIFTGTKSLTDAQLAEVEERGNGDG